MLVYHGLWFNFIQGLIFIFFCFKLTIIHLTIYTQKQKKIKIKPKIKLNLNIYTVNQKDLFLALKMGPFR